MKKAVKVKQRDFTDCGAACMASIASFYNLAIPVSRIRQLASTDKRGTNILGLLEAAKKLKFDAKGVRGDFRSLLKIPKPAIAHVILNGVLQHYVVIYQVTEKYVEVMDPSHGQMHRYTNDEFKKIWTGVLVLMLPASDFEPGNSKVSVYSRIWQLLSPHRSAVIQALFGALVYTIIGLSTSIYVQKIVDYVLIDGNRNLLNLMSVVMVTLLVFQTFIGTTKTIITFRTGQLIDMSLILGYYKHLLTLPQQFFDTMRVGEIISRVNDAVKIRAFINDAIINIAVNIFIVVLAFALMFTYYWKLALIILIVLPVYIVIYSVTNRLNKRAERKVMENAAELETQLVESLNSIHTIKSFGLEEFTNLKTETRFIALLKTIYKSSLNSAFTANSSEFISRLFTIILLWVGAGFVLDNQITPGELLSFYALMAYFTGPIASLINMNKTVQSAMIAADRLFEIFDLDREEENRFSISPELLGDICFRNVSFKYGSRAEVFHNLTLTIPKGKVTAIVGESGSGKSTILAIIQNLYPIQSGQVLIGNYDIRHVDSRSLRALIGVVPQKVDLFAGTVIDNIAVGEVEPDMKRIMDLCSVLGISNFINNLPNDYHTYLGENGATLSGGQKQRIAIARALYKDPEILILDEATSSLDSASEQYVQRVISMLKSNAKTVIIIAHRLSTISAADKILLIDNGTVAEEGTHQQLVQNKGAYYKLLIQQSPTVDEPIPKGIIV